MARKRHKPEEIVAKLRQVDVLTSQGTPIADAIRSIGVTEVTYYRWRNEYGGSEVGPGEAAEGSGDRERSAAQSDLGSDTGQADPAGGGPGKLLSPARRRACIEHVRRELRVSERRACAALGQHRSTQRKTPQGRDDEERLTADIIELARQYGRYGYRKIAALLRDAGWLVNDKRVERIWRREGLKVPKKQPKRGRLWLADGSCVRLRPEHRNHVWSYDFVEDRTHDGRKYRMLNVLDEFTHESLAIRVARKLKAIDVIDVLSDLFIAARSAGAHPLRQRPRVRRQGRAGMDCRRRCQDGLHRARQPLGERLHREFQRPPARRAAGRGDLLFAEGGPDRDRELATSLQCRPPTRVPWLSAAGP